MSIIKFFQTFGGVNLTFKEDSTTVAVEKMLYFTQLDVLAVFAMSVDWNVDASVMEIER